MKRRLLAALISVDCFLIDRFFQRIVDGLARLTTPKRIASFLFTGVVLSNLILAVGAVLTHQWLLGFNSLMLSAACTLIVTQLPNMPSVHGIPLARFTQFPARIILLMPCLVVGIGGIAEGKDWHSELNDASYLTYVTAFYFMACSQNPPPPKRRRVSRPAFALANRC